MAHNEYTTRRELAVVDATTAPMTPEIPAASQGFLMPLDTADSARAAIAAYEKLKQAIIQPSDLQKIGGKQHIKKSGWLRIARAFGLTVEPVSERYETADDGTWGYAIVVRAVAPNGASMQGDGMCWSSEKQVAQRTRHNVRAHAYTRATNRAISNLVGGGEVSAEEIMGDITEEDLAPASAQRVAAPTRPTTATSSTWNPLQDVPLRQALNRLGVRRADDVKAWIDSLREGCATDGVEFNHDNAIAAIELRVAQDEAAARTSERTPALDALDMGAPGN